MCNRWPVSRQSRRFRIAGLLLVMWATAASTASAEVTADQVGVNRGIVVLVDESPAQLAVAFAKASEAIIYTQLPSAEAVEATRAAVDAAGLLGTRVYVSHGDWSHFNLADNLADAVVVTERSAGAARPHRDEIMRVVQPTGQVFVGDRVFTKPALAGSEDWTHPYHGPDNNPNSGDQAARYPYLTQFMAEPWYVPFPEVTVTSGGRMFKAFGHIAFKEREWPWLNTLVGINAYNGTMLWKRDLEPGYIIHRNTIVATPDVLYVADNESCKMYDAATGEILGEITAPGDASGPAWKWMGIQNGVLYALLGEKEKVIAEQRGQREVGGWPWGPWEGFNLEDYATGLGHTLCAFDLATHDVAWLVNEPLPLDGRAICFKGDHLYYYSQLSFLACRRLTDGKEIWRNSDRDLLAAIGPDDKAQNPRQGFFTTAFMKCTDQGIYFAGPQRTALVAASADDGRLMWSYPSGNFQLVLRSEGLYAMGSLEDSKKFDPLSGEILEDLACRRRACTRATGSVDAVFSRGTPGGGTLRFETDDSQARRIALMRPACHDGVVISGGQLYWGPWMCDCNLQLVGLISLASAGDFDFEAVAREEERLETFPAAEKMVAGLPVAKGDWPAYRANNGRSAASAVAIPQKVTRAWQHEPSSPVRATAPVTAGGLTVVSGSDGIVKAFNAASGALKWKAYTGGPVRYPPAVADGRVFVGSGDGWVYAFNATSGKSLWRFRAAPAERAISLYGRLSSTWPVGGGVLVDGDTVYAAAGIASYDGTHVYALEAATGKIQWQNNTSGDLDRGDAVGGISVQGHLLLDGGRLYMPGGNVVSPAIYDTSDGTCLNELTNEWGMAARGRELFKVNGRVMVFDKLLYGDQDYNKPPNIVQQFVQAELGDVLIRGIGGKVVRIAPGAKPEETVVAPRRVTDAPQRQQQNPLVGLWESNDFAQPMGLALGTNAVAVIGRRAGGTDGVEAGYAVAALSLDKGNVLWSEPLDAEPALWGIALDGAGRVIVTMSDGRVAGYSAAE